MRLHAVTAAVGERPALDSPRARLAAGDDQHVHTQARSQRGVRPLLERHGEADRPAFDSRENLGDRAVEIEIVDLDRRTARRRAAERRGCPRPTRRPGTTRGRRCARSRRRAARAPPPGAAPRSRTPSRSDLAVARSSRRRASTTSLSMDGALEPEARELEVGGALRVDAVGFQLEQARCPPASRRARLAATRPVTRGPHRTAGAGSPSATSAIPGRASSARSVRPARAATVRASGASAPADCL